MKMEIKYKKVVYTFGRPIKYTYEFKAKLLEKLVKYIDTTEYPTMPDFCVKNSIAKQRVYEFASDKLTEEDRQNQPLGIYFTDCIKRMNDKQEAFLEENGLVERINVPFAIFKLKQLGWTDRQQIDHSATDEMLKAITERNKAIKEAIENSDL